MIEIYTCYLTYPLIYNKVYIKLIMSKLQSQETFLFILFFNAILLRAMIEFLLLRCEFSLKSAALLLSSDESFKLPPSFSSFFSPSPSPQPVSPSSFSISLSGVNDENGEFPLLKQPPPSALSGSSDESRRWRNLRDIFCATSEDRLAEETRLEEAEEADSLSLSLGCR